MFKNKPAEKTPFWMDGSDPSYPQTSKRRRNFVLVRVAFRWVIYIGIFVFLALSSSELRSSWIFWGIAVFYLMIVGSSFFLFNRAKSSSNLATDIQAQAKKQTNASHIGSAIHVAGHPLLSRDQPVVIALNQGRLSFYSYESPIPIDEIELKDIQALQPVIYDDERVPHMDILDSAAQALQIVFVKNQQTWTCLLRKMRPFRPTDWYHAIQQANYQAGQS